MDPAELGRLVCEGWGPLFSRDRERGQSQVRMTVRSSQVLPSATHRPRLGAPSLPSIGTDLGHMEPRVWIPTVRRMAGPPPRTPALGTTSPLDFLVFCKFLTRNSKPLSSGSWQLRAPPG